VDAAESEWVAVAWPIAFGQSGFRVFLVTSSGDIFQCANDNTRYEGANTIPFDPYHLLPQGWKAGDALPADGFVGWFGTVWKPRN
jgi:hypothetical protein